MCAALLWGIIGPISKLIFSEGVQPLEVAFWRAALAWLFFGTHAAFKRQLVIRKQDLPLVTVFSFFGVAVFFGSYQLAVESGGAALAAVLLYTAPAWVGLMSRIFFKERLTWSKLAALVLTIAGIVLISTGHGTSGQPSVNISSEAVLFGLLAGFSYSLYYIFGKHFSNRYSSPTLFTYMLPVGALCILPWVQFSRFSPTVWLAMMCIAFFCTYGAYYCYYAGLKYLEATRAAITATLEPVIASVVAFLWWGESFTSYGYIGSSFILFSVLLIIIESRQ